MDVQEYGRAFKETNGDYEFTHTKVILKNDSQYFYATTKRRFRDVSEIDPSTLKLQTIPTKRI